MAPPGWGRGQGSGVGVGVGVGVRTYTEIVLGITAIPAKKESGIVDCLRYIPRSRQVIVFSSVAHTSHSLKARHAILTPTRLPFPDISKSQKSERDNWSGLSRPVLP